VITNPLCRHLHQLEMVILWTEVYRAWKLIPQYSQSFDITFSQHHFNMNTLMQILITTLILMLILITTIDTDANIDYHN